MKKFLQFLTAFAVMLVAESRTASAAIERLPIGSAEALVEDARTRVDEVGIAIAGGRPEDTLFRTMYNKLVFSHTLPDGREESIVELARRSLPELEAFIGAEIKKGVEESITTGENTQELVGSQLVAIYYLISPLIQQGPPLKGNYILIEDHYDMGSDVFKTPPKSGDIPPKLYTVNLVESVKHMAYRRTYPLTVPGISSARITEEDESGNTIKSTKDKPGTPVLSPTINEDVEYSLVYQVKDDTLFIAYHLLMGAMPANFNDGVVQRPTTGKGTIRIWYRDGSEQLFRREDGAGLITYLSPLVEGSEFRRLGVPRLTADGIALPYEAEDDEKIYIEFSADFRNWIAYPRLPVSVYPPVTPSGAKAASLSLLRIRTATAPNASGYGFYRARRIFPPRGP